MSARRSVPRARSLLPVAVLALVALPAGAQAWPGLNGYIAYGSNRTGSQFSDDVYVTPLDVESPIRLTFRPPDDGQPAWSPDGRRSRPRRRALLSASRSRSRTAHRGREQPALATAPAPAAPRRAPARACRFVHPCRALSSTQLAGTRVLS
jgi:hypothetical protein